MTRSTKSSTVLLLLTMGTSTLAGVSNTRGPGGWGDWWNNRAGKLGGPLKGYHVRTEDVSKSWNDTVKCLPLDKDYRVNQNGTPADAQNQRIVKDEPADAFYLYVDPANGVAPDGGYDYNNNKFEIPQKEKNAGYPHTPLPASISSVLGAGNANGAARGVKVLRNAADTNPQTYASVAAANDYMLIFFGGQWCEPCRQFTPRFTQWYAAQNKMAEGKKFEVVYATDDLKANFASFYGSMPWKAFSLEAAETGGLTLSLQTLVGVQKVPYVAIINNKGEILKCNAVQAMQGNDTSGLFPFQPTPEFFQNQPILPNPDDCDTDPAEQRKTLKQWAAAALTGISDQQIREFAQKHDIDVTSVSAGELKAYVLSELKKRIDVAQGDTLTEIYGWLNNPEFYRFKVGQYVRVKACDGQEVCPGFVSDDEGTGKSATVPVWTNEGTRNVGVIKIILSTDGAIGVQFKNNAYNQVYIKPEHFKYIEQISAEEYANPEAPGGVMRSD